MWSVARSGPGVGQELGQTPRGREGGMSDPETEIERLIQVAEALTERVGDSSVDMGVRDALRAILEALRELYNETAKPRWPDRL